MQLVKFGMIDTKSSGVFIHPDYEAALWGVRTPVIYMNGNRPI